MRKIKIFYISKYAHTPQYGNTSRHFMLSKYMNSIDHLVTLIYSRSNGDNHRFSFKLFENQNIKGLKCVKINGVLIKQMGVNFRRMFSWIQFEINLLIYFLLLPKCKRPDIVIASSFSLFTFYTVGVLKKIFNFKMVVEVRDLTPQNELEFNRISEKSFSYKLFKYVELFGFKHADKYIGTMPKLDNYLIEQNISNPDVICIPQGFDKEENNFFIKGMKKSEAFIVMYSGSIGEVNMVEELCICADILKDEKIEFIIYGDGPLKEKLQKQFSYLDNLHFKGRVNRSQIIYELQNADLVVNMWANIPMYKYGVSPNKWVDYMLAAKPILVSYNGFKSIINEANCGWFIEANNPYVLADKILKLSKKERSFLNEIGSNGQKYAFERLDYQVLAKEFLNFIIKD